MWGISWLAEEVSASHEELFSMEIVGCLVIVIRMQTEVAEHTNKHGALPQYTQLNSLPPLRLLLPV